MKKIIALAVAASLACSFTACDDFLDSENYTEANSGNYPGTAADLNKELAALYGCLNAISNNPLNAPFFVNILASDDCNGGGGTGDTESHAAGHLMVTNTDYYGTSSSASNNTWHVTYVAIARANAILGTDASILNSIEETKRNQLLGECYFLRGLFYLWGAQMWGDIPAYYTSSAPDPCPQQSAEEVIYPHILADFMSAYNLMTYGATTQGDGHATKGAAAGFLARAYMFYEGFYKKVSELATANPEAVTLPAQQGVENTSLSKADVVAALENAKASGQYGLIEDYRLLWDYTNKYTAPTYAYVEDLAANKQYWAGNGNKEQVFQIQYGNTASWNGTTGMGFCNMSSLYVSLRCDDDGSGNVNGGEATFPYAQGWGQGTVNAQLWDDWNDEDPRKKATIIDCQSELANFVFTTSCTEDAGYYNKKLCAVTVNDPDNGNVSNWASTTSGPYTFWDFYRTEAGGDVVPGTGNSMQGSHYTDFVLMRYSDILLMHTELTGDASGMNEVRARVGLSAQSYSLINVQNERRFEFACEGLRFNDLRRWSGKNGGSDCLAAKTLQRKDGTRVNYTGNWTTMHHASSSWSKRYADTDGFWPIPSSQINIVSDASVLKQNPGWEGSECIMTTAPIYN